MSDRQWWSHEGRSHAPAVVNNGLIDVDSTLGMYRSWELSAARDVTRFHLPCGSGASGSLTHGSMIVGMDEGFIEYQAASGAWRALACPSVREGVGPSSSCRKLGFGTFKPNREIVYLGNGRTMVWDRSTMAYDLYTFAPRGPVLTNSSANPFLVPVGGVGRGAANGRLAGIHNESTLHHLKLPLAAGAGLPKFRHVVLELLPGGRSYRVWNSEGWSHGALRGEGDAGMFRRSPLAGPVGRGAFPSVQPPREGWNSATDAEENANYYKGVIISASPNLPLLVEVDTHEGSYRSIGVKVLDMDTLEPATTHQPPLHFEVLADGSLDAPPSACEGWTTKAECAAAGGACGWCEQVDGVRQSTCMAGGPERPCAASTCAVWHFADLGVPPPIPPSPPPPSPPGLDASSLARLEEHSQHLKDQWPTPPISADDLPVFEPPEPVAANEAPKKSRWWRPLEQLALRPFDAPQQTGAW